MNPYLILLGLLYFTSPRAVHAFVYHFFVLVEHMFVNLNQTMNPEMWKPALAHYGILEEEQDNNRVQEQEQEQEPKPASIYEDKYLAQIRKLNKEWIFTEEEQVEEVSLTETLFNQYLQEKKDEIEQLTVQIVKLEESICETEWDTDLELDDDMDAEIVDSLGERRREINELKQKYADLKQTVDSEEEQVRLRESAGQDAYRTIVNRRLENLKNSFIMETTPHGNVLMIYNAERESFSYYSDNTLPYRYLEVAARKYVKTFHCRPLYVDMEEELEKCEQLKKEEQAKKQEQEEEQKRLAATTTTTTENNPALKKNVFAKFKSYNRDGGISGKMAAPPKNSIPSNKTLLSKDDVKAVLKERANRYTYEGKFANFHFLQKVEKKVFNKNLALSFADFKKMQKKQQ